MKVLLLAIIFAFTTIVSTQEEEVVVRILGGPRVARIISEEMGYYYKGPLNGVATLTPRAAPDGCRREIPERENRRRLSGLHEEVDVYGTCRLIHNMVLGFRNTYTLIPLQDNTYATHHKRGVDLTKRMLDDERVVHAEYQQEKKRFKRDYFLPFFQPKSRTRRLQSDLSVYKRPPVPVYDKTFNDELWVQEWYMQDTRTRPDLPKLDLNVLPVYRRGITGKGVRISILDDGLEYTHDDLHQNYDPAISWDCNEEDADPMPRYEPTNSNSHGTRCAGEIAMVANNGKCGVGIAYNSKVGGVKLLDGVVNDRTEGTALSYALDLVDIYSASWGPNDDGQTVDGPGWLAKEALERGITEGRQGKGSIYVWASGNGGAKGDNCNCDGYLASPYTISIGSASQRGEFPWYGEACASTLAVTYSSGAYKDQMIATTDLFNDCTVKHTGTSASAPLAAGIIALALEVNSDLTWRDTQHLIVWTSEPAPVANNPGWQKNAAGLWFNTKFGSGLMNAFAFVKTAANWTTIPERHSCTVEAMPISNNFLSYDHPLTIPINVNDCDDTPINYLEHVEVLTNINYTRRGVLEVHLTSPSGTKVELLAPRKLDDSTEGFNNWTFMSVMTWGENPNGVWTLSVSDNSALGNNTGTVGQIWLTVHGTEVMPEHMKGGARVYNKKYNYLRTKNSKERESAEWFGHKNSIYRRYDYD